MVLFAGPFGVERSVALEYGRWDVFYFCLFYYLAHILLSRDEHIIQNLPARADLPASAFVSLFCTCPSLLSSVHGTSFGILVH